MPVTKIDYESLWKSFSWEIDEAVDSFFAVCATLDWSKRLETRLKSGSRMPDPSTTPVTFLLSKSLATYFFIAAVRIRDNARSDYNLPKLLKKAIAVDLLSPEQIESANAYMLSTKKAFGVLKKARGNTVAHLTQLVNPFTMLQQDGIMREDVARYMKDCESLFYLLGEPIGQSKPVDFTDRQQSVTKEMDSVFENLWSTR